jgi:hypothetical protein
MDSSRTLEERLPNLPLWENQSVSVSNKIQLLTKEMLQSLQDGKVPTINLPHISQSAQGSLQTSSQATTHDCQMDRPARFLRIDPDRQKRTDRYCRLVQVMDAVHVRASALHCSSFESYVVLTFVDDLHCVKARGAYRYVLVFQACPLRATFSW